MYAVFSIVFLSFWTYVNTLENGTEECAQSLCLKCGPVGCVKCPEMIVFSTRKCVEHCPFGHKPSWSTNVDYMGLVCTPNGNFLGLSHDLLAILAGILTGTLFCVVLLTGTIFYFKYRRKRATPSIESTSDIEEAPEKRTEFTKQLESFKPYAQIFLDMLNDTRKRMRNLHLEGDNCSLQAYKPVVRDLTKILILLNRKNDKITVPDDWENLFAWAERTLQRYKRMSECSQLQVSQLVNFLQEPSNTDGSIEDLDGSTTMSTFKPHQPLTTSSTSLQDIAIHNFNSNYDSKVPTFNPQWKFQYSLVSNSVPTTEFSANLWKNSKEYLNSSWLMDDDFLQLGFRPQDEITTEL